MLSWAIARPCGIRGLPSRRVRQRGAAAEFFPDSDAMPFGRRSLLCLSFPRPKARPGGRGGSRSCRRAGARGCLAGAGAHRRRRFLGLAEPRAADLRVISSRSLWFFPGCSCAPCASIAFGIARAGRHLGLETTRCRQNTLVRSRDSNGKQRMCHGLLASSAERPFTPGTASAKQWQTVSQLAGMKEQIGSARRLAASTRRLDGDSQSLIPNP